MRSLGRQKMDAVADAKTLRDYNEQLDGQDFVRARPMTVVVPAGVEFAVVSHGLRRKYAGGFCVGSSVPASVALPADVDAIGIDSTVYLVVKIASVQATDTTVNVRYF